MTTLDRTTELERLAARFDPAVSDLILRAFQDAGDSINIAAVERALRNGDLLGALSAIPLENLQETVRRDLAKVLLDLTTQAAELAALPPSVTMSFDLTNEAVFGFIRDGSLNASLAIKRETEAAIREYIRRSFSDGIPTRTIAREMRGVVGLTDRQVTAVANYRDYLEKLAERGTESLSQTAKDKILRSFGARSTQLGVIERRGLSADRIDALTEGYAKRLIAERAQAIARTVTIDSSNEGQNILWRQARDEGLLDFNEFEIEWSAETGSACLRCLAMDGQRRTLDGTYPGGQGPPTLHIKCRCSEILRRVN